MCPMLTYVHSAGCLAILPTCTCSYTLEAVVQYVIMYALILQMAKELLLP